LQVIASIDSTERSISSASNREEMKSAKMAEDQGSKIASRAMARPSILDLQASSFFALFVVGFSSLTRIDQKRL